MKTTCLLCIPAPQFLRPCRIALLVLCLMTTPFVSAQTLYVPGSIGSISGANVGIGTNSPDGKLSIQNVGASDTINLLTFSENADPEFFFESGFSGTNSTGNHLKLRTYWGNIAMTWRGDGNVGIGTDAPSQKLDIAGAVRIEGALVSPEGTLRDDNGGWVRTYGSTGWYNNSYGGGWYMSDTSWIRTYGNKGIYHNAGTMRTDGTLQVGSSGSTLNVATNGSFAYRTNVLFANTAGRVGIGTSSPTHLLTVNGTVRAEEVLVESGIAAKEISVRPQSWADDVFEDGYRLKALSEVAAHIEAEGHLPDVPSAATVAEQGVSVGEMQSTLLRKIEELTLYVIRLDESNQQLVEENRKLRADVDLLKRAAGD